jgi:serine/threonine protein kinase/tetratricopeptide (TPR) repeat protein
VIGQTISHYRIVEKLGEGGMGVVYKAHDTKLDRTVALKFLPSHLGADETEKQRFLNEAKAASALDHTNICSIYSIEETNEGNLFIVMAYYEGMSLKEKIEQGPLPLKDVVNYSLQIASGLQKAHEKGIVHRDLKPANIFITNDDQIKIIDFGLARVAERTLLTKSGTTLGTVPYMSPEQAQGHKVDHRTDIWSLGVVMYEMITGQRPFKSEYDTALVYSLINEDPEPVTGVRSGVPMELERIINKCLEKDSGDRYQHVDELIVDLRKVERELSSGKRWIEPIHEKRAESTLKEAEQDESGDTKKRSLLHTPMVYIVIAVIAVITGVASYLLFYVPGTPDYIERVLVVPFENRTGDSSLDPVGRTAADWITEGILQSGVVDAVQTTTTLQLIGEDDLAGGGLEDRSRLVELAGATNAGIVISGRFIQIGDDIRFETQIVDAERNEIIYTLDPVRGPRSEPIKVINELQQNILGVLSIHVYPGFDLQFFESPPVYEAYVEYMDGLKFFHRDYEKSIEHFQRVLEIDPDFLQAKLFKGWAYYIMGQFAEADSLFQSVHVEKHRLSPYNEYFLDFSMHRIEGDRQASVATVLQWRSIAPRDQLVNYLLGSNSLGINRPQITIDTYSEFELSDRFIVEAPGGLPWFNFFARAYHRLGEHEKELETVRVGLEFFPEDLVLKSREVEALAALGEIEKVHIVIEESKGIAEPTRGSPGGVMLHAAYELRAHGNREESLEIAEQAIEWYEMNEPENKSELANALYLAERWDKAYRIYEELSREEPDNIGYKGARGVLAAMMENEEEARQLEEALRNVDREYLFGEHTYYRARINALLGKREKAVSLLEKSFDQGRYFSISIHRHPAFEPLRDYPPFQELLEPEG